MAHCFTSRTVFLKNGGSRTNSRMGSATMSTSRQLQHQSRITRSIQRTAGLAMCAVGLCLLLAAGETPDTGSSPVADVPAAPSPPVRIVTVPLPIAGNVDTNLKRAVDQLLEELPADQGRPILVFEFQSPGATGEGSQFERALSLARYLNSAPLRRVRTVAYVSTSVFGHAVLPVLACEELIIHPAAELGAAGMDEAAIDETMRQSYREIANQRRTIPVAVAIGMLDRDAEVLEVETTAGTQFVLASELAEFEKTHTIVSMNTLVAVGDLGKFTGSDLRLEYGIAGLLAGNRQELAAALKVPVTSLVADPSLGGEWAAVQVDLDGPVNSKLAGWIQRSLEARFRSAEANLLVVHLNSAGGDPEASVQLASFLASLDPARVRTVAFVNDKARSDAALIALACDQIVMSDSAVIGGTGEQMLTSRTRQDLRQPIQAIAQQKQRGWSLMMALVDTEFVVEKFRREGTGEIRYLNREEVDSLASPELWTSQGVLDTTTGIRGRQAEEIQLASFLASDLREFQTLYQLDVPPERIQPNWAHQFIEGLAAWSGTLLFFAGTMLMIELSQPGLSVAGFISALCFVLFFWSQYLHGTAGWLEVLLFVAGTIALILEVFVIPGVGVFGIGGGLLIIVSIVLASQTFVIPRNAYQLEQFPMSLLTLTGAGAGVLVSLYLIRRFLPDAPLLNRLLLAPPQDEELDEMQQREALTHYEYLAGKSGQTITQLTPSGKARFGDDLVDVISDGDVIPAGTRIRVLKVRGNHVYVKPIETQGI